MPSHVACPARSVRGSTLQAEVRTHAATVPRFFFSQLYQPEPVNALACDVKRVGLGQLPCRRKQDNSLRDSRRRRGRRLGVLRLRPEAGYVQLALLEGTGEFVLEEPIAIKDEPTVLILLTPRICHRPPSDGGS